ncbi:Predicted DNA-binding transcriptional regulator YafY, contains an HTH and WYL domains [Pilibacter termitis]|uniref:Predicted DNA-binding transcriptional regulator YafY, contains an HTH and WYL domains n=1 Tax=Pilibacter termitis TaxID=263852 RepID=A0A1T4Q2L5_9ENTE|nr:WYL domain-containing protein [Pilibacter termitis]SJZ97866.1 Predicted DNA-binding transcriptional regulator YafY, contains an HTH and WYL domains [Pilibacter termitis]
MIGQERAVAIFYRLMNGEKLNTSELAEEYGVETRTIQRIFKMITEMLEDEHSSLKLEKTRGKYQIIGKGGFSAKQVLTVCKLLLSTKILQKNEMKFITQSFIDLLHEDEQNLIDNILKNELHHYSPNYSNKEEIMEKIWEWSEYIDNKQAVTFEYQTLNREIKQHTGLPQAIYFTEDYCYLFIHSKNRGYDYTYRLDRIVSCKPSSEKITISYADRFEEGKIRIAGKQVMREDTIRVTFEYDNWEEYVFDHLPNVKKTNNNTFETKGSPFSIKSWLFSQGARVKVLSGTPNFVNEYKEEIKKMYEKNCK